jgi:hypothetical protein
MIRAKLVIVSARQEGNMAHNLPIICPEGEVQIMSRVSGFIALD